MVFEFFTKMFSSKPAATPSVNPAPAASFAPAGAPNANQFGNIQPPSFPVNVGGKRRHKKRHTNKRKHSNRKKTKRRK